MTQPPGFTHPEYPTYVCKLNRALYGLKQAPRAWYDRLSHKLVDLGFSPSKSDPSLFIYAQNSVKAYFLVYVDDVLFTGSNPAFLQHIVHCLSTEFPLKDLGPLHYFLGIQCECKQDGLFLSQQKYIQDLLTKTNMSNCKPISTPMAPNSSLTAFDSNTMDDPTLYRSTVGSLQYLLFTRPDLAFAVNRVCQFMHHPRLSHWQAVKRILRYLKHSQHLGLHLTHGMHSALSAFSDADWAGCPDDRKSTSGFCIFYGSNLISWSSKKQDTIARSSTEAEYKAIANATCELLWIQSLLSELRMFLSTSPILYCDNLGATYLCMNPVLHSRTKHVAIDYHFVRDRVQAKTLQVQFLSSKDQLADVLTKPLPVTRFTQLRTSLTVKPLTLDSRGDVRKDKPVTITQQEPSRTTH